jgi:FKBP-type peptidyl-prolyl cis-trans isomerase
MSIAKSSKYLIFVLPVILGSCLSKFLESEDSATAAAEANTILSYAQTNNLKLDSRSGLYYNIVRPNTNGETPTLGSDFYIAYSLKTLTGTAIISKTSRDSVILNIYTSNLFKGFVESLFLLKEGEKGQFVIPSEKAYGLNPPTGVPKSSVILAEIELLDLFNEGEKIDNYIKKKNLKVEEKTNTGLRFIRLNAATTNLALKDNDNVTLKYSGMFLNDKVFDSGTFGYVIGGTNLIPGFIEGIKKMKKGEKARIVFPSTIGYGPNGSGTNIPPYTPLAFDLEIVTVNGM